MERFARTELLLGKTDVDRIRCSRVALFGLGAVGSYALEALARAGVGFIRLVDFDIVRESNFNRQLLALESTLGKGKVEVAADRVAQINPECTIECRSEFVDSEIAPALLKGDLTVAVDAIDSVSPKVALIEAAIRGDVPLVSSLGAASRLDPFSIRVDDISRTSNCPLGKQIRKRLRRIDMCRGIRCVYSVEPPLESAIGPLEDHDTLKRGRPRRPVGSISYVTGMFGLHVAREAIQIILDRTTG